MKKLIVEEENCICCGACVQIDPEHFDFSERGTSHAISNENLDSTVLATAIDSCPVGIIKIVEESNEESKVVEFKDDCSCGNNCQCEEDCKCHKEAA